MKKRIPLQINHAVKKIEEGGRKNERKRIKFNQSFGGIKE